MFPCSGFFDIQCKLCSSCRVGDYIAAPCGGSNDTICMPCLKCADMEYVERECMAGVNTICQSCEQCAFVDPQAQWQCSRSPNYVPWQRQNCCKNRDGQQVSCDQVDLSNIQLSLQSAHIMLNLNNEL